MKFALVKAPGRIKEAQEVCLADKAAAVGRLMLGELPSLEQFLEVGQRNYTSLPRRAIRAGRRDVRQRLAPEVEAFCSKNFQQFSTRQLAALYDDVAPALRTFGVAAMPMPAFESRYGRLQDAVLKGDPRYATVVLSTRGLQFQYPEDQISKDLIAALDLMKVFGPGSPFSPADLAHHGNYIARQRQFAARACVAAAFNLLEAYLSGVLWENLDRLKTMTLTRKDAQMVQEPTSATLVQKIRRLPEFVAGQPLPPNEALDRLLSIAKPFRDSLMHPAPFSAPEKMGGYDKLSHFHAIDVPIARAVTRDAVAVIQFLGRHIARPTPRWLTDLERELTSDEPSALHAAFESNQRQRKTP